jgi:hypothetical protein
MKAMLLALFTLLLANPLWAAKAGVVSKPMGAEATLTVAARYVDQIFVSTLAELRSVASTPEAKQADWYGIKRYLKQLEADLPGVYFFVLPNGNYYSAALDYTNLNLSDRAYFKSLFAGRAVKGYPLYSRSSGKKSALLAVPITVDGKVTGAIGASVFLDDLHARLNRDLALPNGYTWFVLDAKGKTLLDKDSDFIFMNALTQGSKSLRTAVAKALQHESGSLSYELNGIPRQGYYRKLPSMGWWMFLVKTGATDIQVPPQLELSLGRFVPDLQHGLDQIDASLARLVKGSRLNATDDRAIRRLLDAVLQENPYVVEAAFVDRKGVLRQIEPSEYKNFEDVDISSQEHVIALRKSRKPVFSSGFMSVEGFLAVDLARPLYDANKAFIGSISLLIRPKLLVDPLLKKSTVPKDYELWIMQPDGMIVYDQDKDEIGRMLFSDPLYAGYDSLLALGKQIATQDAGKGSYIFVARDATKKAIKNAVWQTVCLHGRVWRVVLNYRPYD